jgi:hypothetical protein
MGGCKKVDVGFVAGSFVFWGRGLATLLLFLYVTKEAGRKYVRDMPWPLAAECNMITNKQTASFCQAVSCWPTTSRPVIPLWPHNA